MKNVMVVEDEPDIAEMLADVLTARGCHPHAVLDGRSALDALRRASSLPQAIVLDLVMPAMDGRAFLDELRRDRALADIPVIALSGHSSGLAEIAAITYATFLKPVSFHLLCAALERACKGLPARR